MIKIISLLVFLYINVSGRKKNDSLIYVLQWLSSDSDKLIEDVEHEQEAFFDRKCKFVNCYVANSKSLLGLDVTDFDVILFNVINIRFPMVFPLSRKAQQKYIFYGKDPAAINIISNKFDDFFNFTWTYKLDSDISIPYIVLTNKRGDVMGPKTNMNWMNIALMKPTKKSIINKLKNKKLAVAWIMNNCRASNRRIRYVEVLQEELLFHKMTVDIYGCGYLECPKNDSKNECNALMADYYFYLAFENTFSEDYVTEKVLYALNHYAVPVVYGGANYTRFLPDGSYLNARVLEPTALAKEIIASINDRKKLYDYFKWHRYYNLKDAFKYKYKDGVCDFCAMINNAKLKNKHYHSNLSRWWNGPLMNVVDPVPTIRKTLRVNQGNNTKNSIVTTSEEPEVEKSYFGDVASKLYNFFFEL